MMTTRLSPQRWLLALVLAAFAGGALAVPAFAAPLAPASAPASRLVVRVGPETGGSQSVVPTAKAVAPALDAVTQFGYLDAAYPSSVSIPSGTKPESKLWYTPDGIWWGSLYSSAAPAGFHIFKLNTGTHAWTDTGVAIDTRASSKADTLWDGTKLYVASHVFTSSSSSNSTGNPARLYRYSYDSGAKTWSLDAGFPAAINNVSSETLVFDKDGTGVLWATWTQASSVYITHTTTDDKTWATPFVLPAASATGLSSDDISDLIAFGPGKIGLMWSDQTTAKMEFSVHADGDPDTTWSATVHADQGAAIADDHINLKKDSAGRVYAAVKTSQGSPASAPLMDLLVRSTSGTWTRNVFGTVGDSNTRPIVVIDEAAGLIHMYATGKYPGTTSGQSGGTIYEKTSAMPPAAISFPAGNGTPVVQDPASGKMNDVTSTKQSVSSSSGLVVLATNNTTRRYWHAEELFGPPPPPPTAAFTWSPPTGTAGSPVAFTDGSTGGATGWDWDFGDLSAHSGVQSPSHTFAAAGTYIVTLTAFNAGGPSAPVSHPVTVNPAAPGSTITLGPVADAQVYSNSSAANYGSLATFRTREDPVPTNPTYRSYLRFNVSGLTGTVTSVKLRLFVTDASSNVQSVLAVADTTWGESTITWANKPATGASVGSAAATPVSAYLEIPLNVSAISANGLVSFALQSASTDSAVFSSKEAASNPPQLVITQTTGGSAPTADFSGTPTSGPVGLNVTFDASASTGTGLTYAWTFGDGGIGTGVNPTHQYNAVGTWTVGLTVTDASSVQGTKTRTNYIVVDSTPIASFTQDKTTGPAPLTVAFDGSGSTGTNLVYAWNFGDPGSGSANTSNLQTPSHTFSTVSSFSVTLTVSNAAGTSGPATQTITTTVGSGATLTFNPVADAQVYSSHPTTSDGAQTTFRTREGTAVSTNPTYRSYLKFTVSGITGTVTSIKLRLFVTDASPNVQSVFAIADNTWTETGITWTNAPVIGGSAVGSAAVPTLSAYNEITINSSAIAADGTFTFALKSAGTDSAIFSAREAGTNPPQLVIVTGP